LHVGANLPLQLPEQQSAPLLQESPNGLQDPTGFTTHLIWMFEKPEYAWTEA
jgi:hypothetical protein